MLDKYLYVILWNKDYYYCKLLICLDQVPYPYYVIKWFY